MVSDSLDLPTVSKDVFCHISSITDGNMLCEGDMVEYQTEYDDHKGKYTVNRVTGRKENVGVLTNRLTRKI